jgi:predicted nucleotidyltransferase
MKTITEIINILQTKRAKLVSNYGISKIGVFGSYARGEQNAESDVDIMVEFNAPIGMKFIDLADELEGELKLKVDLVSRKAIREKMWAFIEKEVVYV